MGDVRVRAVTVGVPAAAESSDELFARLVTFFARIETNLAERGYDVQTRRLALEPANAREGWTRFRLVRHLESLSRRADEIGVRWLCQPIDPWTGWSDEELRLASIEVIRRLPNVFLHYRIATDGIVHTANLEGVARAILDVAKSSRNGFDNFRVGAGSNVRPGGAYLPFTFHSGEPCFSLAIEPTERVLAVVERHPEASLRELHDAIAAELAGVATEIAATASATAEAAGLPFRGLDLSLSPFPAARRSVGEIVRKVSRGRVGTPGSLAATASLTSALKQAARTSGAPTVGFNGVMYSPLEDAELAAAMSARQLGLTDLMLWSAVCGCGLDMVPIPGAALVEQVVGLLLDVASLSCTLEKPLGVRVLPIPGKGASEMTDFNHDFLSNTRIQGVAVEGPELHWLRRNGART